MRSNLIVEADADYWHGNPDKYDDFDEIQEKNRKKDKRKNSKIRSKGYNLVRFWGSEIRKSNFGKRLVEEIKKYE